ncbi:MAG TPA: glucose-1-phosphate adenylyltransferase [Planctomycetota bacterium]|nr:glucose-1-phosphate adenylyltransferase [Planctomycetota bacterium]
MDPSRVITVILAGGKGQRLEPLTRDRAKPAVPFGGVYRIIDFALSNCMNSGLRKVMMLVQYRSRSLLRHLRDGWQMMFNPAVGEFLESLPPQHHAGEAYTGTADAVYQNLFVIREEEPEAVLILAGDHIYKMDYRHLLRYHQDRGADATVAAVEVRRSEAAGQFGVLEIDEAARIVGFEEKPRDPKPIPGNPELCLGSMGIYVFKPDVLYALLEQDARDPLSAHDFGKNIIPKMVGRHAIYAFSFIDENKKAAKYWRDVGTIDAYYEANMDLVAVTPELNLYDQGWPIRNIPVTAPPPKFVFAQHEPGRVGLALDSMVSPGCIVSGGRVERSILSPFVRINSYSLVTDSILFENVNVGRHAKLHRTIVDKGVNIPEGMQIGYFPEEDRKRFTVTESGIVVISKGTVL